MKGAKAIGKWVEGDNLSGWDINNIADLITLFTLGTLGPDLASRTGRTLRAFIALGSSGTLRTGRSDRARGSLCAERGGSRHGSEEENQDRPGDDRSITLHEYLHREPT